MKVDKKLVLVFLAAVAIGSSIFLNLNSIVSMVQQNTSPLLNMISLVTTRIQEFLGQLPAPVQALLTGTVPLAIGAYALNWWRLRQQNQQAQQALTRIQELNAQNLDSQTAAQKQIQTLQAQVEQYQSQPNLSSTITDLQGSLSETQALVTRQATEIQNLITERNTLSNLVEEMKLKTYPVTVVK